MPQDRFLIAPFESGLQTNMRPWLIPEDAFEYLQNAYVFRGRIRKRFGSEWMGTTQLQTRLRYSLGANTNAAISLPANTTAHTPQLAIGQMFSLDNDVFMVYQLGAGVATLSTSNTVTAVIDSVATPNTITFTGGSGSNVYWYPALPVMGITQYESGAVNNHPTYAFDTQFAYLFSGGSWGRSGTAQWNGSDLNYFWSTNWEGVPGTVVMFVTNFNATVPTPGATDDPIWSFDGTTWTAATGNNAFYFRPGGGAIHTGPYVKTARIIVAFKNRLVLLNTVENDNSGGAGVNTAFTNRARYCFYGSPFAANAWYEKNQTDGSGNVAAGGGFVDAATDEQIISAEFIKDRLIVYFERSTWELVYTNNQVLPFVWQKINTELGAMSTFSIVPFDKDVLGIGQSGIHACNGANVVRIDDKIPDYVFEFETDNNANQRTAGIRDYYTELVYWTYVDDLKQPFQKFPNQILVYNYKSGSWALNDDCITTFGYFEQASDTTWANSVPTTWSQAGYSWNSNVIQAQQRQILFGTPEGFINILNPERSRNAPALSITNMAFTGNGFITLTIINHNLTSQPIEFDYDNDFILIENVVADATTMAALNGGIFSVYDVVNANSIIIDTNNRTLPPLLSGTYKGNGTAARVSNVQIKSKQWNPYVNQDRGFYLSKIDFAVERTATGAITVDYYPNASRVGMIAGGTATGAIMGNNVLETSPYSPTYYPFEQYQDILHHPIYFQSQGEFIQIAMSFSLDQMINPLISLSDFEMHGITLYTQPTSVRLQ
ncbi:MAG TPA: hypothetical protein VL443_06360 [Cyclobacteriaceae bacterium]|jgi:hypothetical protein|nr:hypothetical protein [Cyclobacteriaceae bacterium]